MKKVSDFHIEQLYRFTRKHYVEYYDVQTELVDHLANGIEEQWQVDSEIPFEEALKREFNKFGVFGFSEVVEMKGAALEKQYFKLIWQEIKRQVLQPKEFFFLMSLFAGILFILISGNIEANLVFTCIYFILVFYYIFKTSSKLKQKKKKGEKIFLMEHYILNVGQYFSLFYIPFQVISFSDVLETNFFQTQFWLTIPVAAFFTLMIFTSYICLHLIPKKKDEILQNHYPELKF